MNKFLYLLAGICFVQMNAQTYNGGSTFGGTGITSVLNNFKDSSNNLYTVGLYNSAFDFAGVNYPIYGGNSDGFLLKYDENGNELMAFTFGGNRDDLVSAGTCDADGNIYLTGNFQGGGPNSFDADPGPGQFLLANASAIESRDCFIIKLDNTGTFVWAKQISNTIGAGAEDPNDIMVDSSGNIYVAGRFHQADFDPGAGVDIVQTSSGQFEGFLLKLTNDGDFQWVRHIKDAENYAYGIAFDADENPTVIGKFKLTVSMDPADANTVLTSNGGFDGYAISYDAAGNYVDSFSFGGAGNDSARRIVSTPSGFAIGGQFTGTVDMDPGDAQLMATSLGSFDAFINQFDSNGAFLHSYFFGAGGDEDVFDLTADDNGNLVAAGTFTGAIDFDIVNGGALSTATGQGAVYTLAVSPDNNYLMHGMNNSSLIAKQGSVEVFGTKIVTQGHFKTDVDLDPFSSEDIVTTNSLYKGFTSWFDFTILGTEDIDPISADISIYPNPASDFIKVSDNNYNNYRIFNAEGRLILNGTLNNNSVDIQSLNPGAYMIQLSNGTEYKNLKFLKK